MSITPTPHDPQIEPRHVGFLERRWNMVKAFAGSALTHLFSIKTWVTAGVIFGGMAFLGTGAAGEMAQTIASYTAVTPENLPFRMMQALAMGTVINAGVAMYKEAKRCDDCDALATQIERSLVPPGGPAVELARHHAHSSPDVFVPQPTPASSAPTRPRVK